MATSISYTVQRPGEGTAILNAYRDLAAATAFSRLTGLYAFASFKGVRLITSVLRESPSWKKAAKRWVISIDGGITEPDALRFLLSLQKAEVRVPYAEELLTRKLKPIYRFHPKTLLLERRDAAFVPAAIMVGSANLTCSGLCFGHEHALSARTLSDLGSLPPAISNGLVELEKVIAWATVVDAAFIDRYAAIRPAVPSLSEEFEDKRADLILQEKAVIPPAQAAALIAAAHFWIDIDYVVPNRGKDQEGNQIDMQRGSRLFFGFGDGALAKNSHIGSVSIRYGTHAAARNLRFGNNSMDKLDLPIPDVEGPPSYGNQTLLFTRESPTTFRLRLGTPADIAAWKTESEAAGTLFKMQSGREFGVF
ncbi:MAG: hypothetical protein AABO41_02460 [Acidobacteriota bacterium]